MGYSLKVLVKIYARIYVNPLKKKTDQHYPFKEIPAN